MAAAALPLALSAAGCLRNQPDPATGTARPLPIPPLDTGRVGADGVRRFALRAQPGTSEILSGVNTPTWGYNGSILGPTLRARSGEAVAFDITNNLPEVTTVHWHGMRVPARCDGGPHQSIDPGGSWAPEWTVDQDAATLWYHPHPHGATEKHVYRGLSGFFLVDDDVSDALGLPRHYGVDDIPLAIQDRRFTSEGALDETDDSKYGLLGDTIITNGIADAYLPVRTERIRLRILNGSSSRLFNLARSDDAAFDLIATDGGLLEKPISLNRIQLSPGERAEIVLELRPAQTVTLRSLPIEPRAGLSDPASFGFDDTFDILTLRAEATLTASPALPGALASIPPLVDAATPAGRSFELQWYMINGQRMDMNRIDLEIPVDSTEVWEIRNADNWPHNFHIHDVRFQVVSIDGEAPPPALSGWKDTIYTEPGRTYHVSMRFSGEADPTYPYMYHCHLLRHEDQGMMGQFLVLAPGQEPTPMVMPMPMSDPAGGGHSGHGG
ncbi:MAG: multicopper oxidase domain-containing protein [Mycobacterium sp.]